MPCSYFEVIEDDKHYKKGETIRKRNKSESPMFIGFQLLPLGHNWPTATDIIAYGAG